MRARFSIVGVILAACSTASPAAATVFTHPRLAAAAAPPAGHATLVELTSPGAALSPALRAAGAQLVSADLDVWRLPAKARGTLAALRAEGFLEHAERDQRLVPFSQLEPTDPLLSEEWWQPDVGSAGLQPPGSGIPLTVVDTGLDLAHPEFSDRPDTTALNRQVVVPTNDPNHSEIHGTAVSSVAAAPVNGRGLVGIYPQATLDEWDIGAGDLGDVLEAMDSISKRGRTVVNFSGGFKGYSALLSRAVDRALHRGIVVVAAAGNFRAAGSPPFAPAMLPHVLTVGATNRQGRVASFSNRSDAVDVAAPGVQIPVAVPTFFVPTGYTALDGTSFSAPLVSGAAAWVWTVRPELDPTQLQDVLRRSARDVGPPGWDPDTGYGILSVQRALTEPVPPPDPQEPNDDVNLVRPHALTASGTRLRTPAALHASLDTTEDPEDVYRVWVPRGARISVRTASAANVDLAVWGSRTTSIYERGKAAKRDLLAYSQHPGSRAEAARARNRTRAGVDYFVDVFPGRGAASAAYVLKVSVARP